MSSFQVGEIVKWNWGAGSATGKIAERFERKVTRQISGEKITRNGSSDAPAFLIEQDDGGRVLKLESELEKT
ncbi:MULTISPECIES: DUF2945 domain-containing protein [Roseobacteraceae]|uniref:DUF2945 domain-containing protein n=1 Tax=Roseobacteraceae TaxID=2854170 RepID=UPI0013BC236C|nr:MULTISPECIES: DUF2945 domain-containing protein [Roseobacteraceae]MCA0997534.1 DUF2945 domain-containing protein [Alloyangia pacifica]NDV99008.1 HVA1 family protein [Salipiger sp. PrR002]NDW55961.1 HVA1 family protein [Salipiger sp. PrR004]